MRFRKLRIAWSVACGISAVLLCLMWVRSYRAADRLDGRIWFPRSFLVASKEGAVACIVFRWHGAENWWRWDTVSYPVDDELSFPGGPVDQFQNAIGFGWLDQPMYMVMRSTQKLPDGSEIMVWGAATATLNGGGPIVPYWLLVVMTSCAGAAPLVSRRFSLRALLIVVTLVAVVLGLIVWAAR
jgi:hypothetical protein